MSWTPSQYHKFEAERRRPADDLVAALPALAPRSVVDLGCGGGALARRLAAHWPQAVVTGVDSSAAMLELARATPSPVTWVEADLNHWQPDVPMDVPMDVIVSNAALHWLGDHRRLLPRLAALLAPGGVLAVQMPRNFGAPSHALLRATAAEPQWAERLAGVYDLIPVHGPAEYYDWLAPVAKSVDIWETEYLHALHGDNPALEWTKGTALVPVRERLEASAYQAFLASYGARLAQAYPARPDGVTLFPFRRLFIIARV
ncbi:Trans-aconitate 2-methyltransferase [uncultured Gammaproteobacteria bacterium]